MNFVEGELVAQDGGAAFEAGKVLLSLSAVKPRGAKKAILGIRPEHIMMPGSAGSTTVKLEMTILLVEPQGATCLVTLEREGVRLLTQVDARQEVVEGLKIEVGLDMERAYWFDSSTGAALGTACASG